MINKINIKQTLDRRLAFYERRLENGILATINVPPQIEKNPESPANEEIRIRQCSLLDDLDGCLASDSQVDVSNWLCDIIPTLYPTSRFGESIWSGMVGGEIEFAGNDLHTWSHAVKPVIESFEDFSFQKISVKNIWCNRMFNVTHYYINKSQPTFDIRHFVFMDCMNLLVELRGALAAYMDIYDRPGLVEKFMIWSMDENIRVFDAQRKLTSDFVIQAYDGHPCCRYAACNIPDLSIDAYGSCNEEDYLRFGLEYHQAIANHYGGARIHVHSDARRLLPLMTSIGNLTECYLTDDIGFEEPWRTMHDIKQIMGSTPIRLSIPKDIFIDRLQERSLPEGIAFMVSGVSNLDEANKIMERVFKYRSR